MSEFKPGDERLRGGMRFNAQLIIELDPTKVKECIELQLGNPLRHESTDSSWCGIYRASGNGALLTGANIDPDCIRKVVWSKGNSILFDRSIIEKQREHFAKLKICLEPPGKRDKQAEWEEARVQASIEANPDEAILYARDGTGRTRLVDDMLTDQLSAQQERGDNPFPDYEPPEPGEENIRYCPDPDW